MPIHDWTRVEPGDYHHFHQRWISAIADALNTNGLPPGYVAMAEQVTGRPIPDVVALQTNGYHKGTPPDSPAGSVAVATAPPTARLVTHFDKVKYSNRANRVVIRHGRGKVVAIIELVSPGNKDSKKEIAMIKVVAPSMALGVIDRAIQVHGGAGVSQDFPLAYFWAMARTLRLADGPDEVHLESIAKQELADQKRARG